jgi:hypothetical protein
MHERTISGFVGDSFMNSEGCEDYLRQDNATQHRNDALLCVVRQALGID